MRKKTSQLAQELCPRYLFTLTPAQAIYNSVFSFFLILWRLCIPCFFLEMQNTLLLSATLSSFIFIAPSCLSFFFNFYLPRGCTLIYPISFFSTLSPLILAISFQLKSALTYELVGTKQLTAMPHRLLASGLGMFVVIAYI